MTLRNRMGRAMSCWARMNGLRCELAPGHIGEHHADGNWWSDFGLGPVIDLGDALDRWGDAS